MLPEGGLREDFVCHAHGEQIYVCDDGNGVNLSCYEGTGENCWACPRWQAQALLQVHLALAYLVLALFIVDRARAFCASMRRPQGGQYTWKFLRSAVAAAFCESLTGRTSSLHLTPDSSTHDAQVFGKNAVSNRRVERSRQQLTAVRLPLALFLAVDIWYILDNPEPPGSVGGALTAIYGNEFSTVLLLNIVCAFVAHLPELVSPRSLDIFAAVVILHLLKHLAFSKHHEEYLYRHEWVTISRIGVSMVVGNARVTIPVNLLFTLCDLSMYGQIWELGRYDVGLVAEQLSLKLTPPVGFVGREMMTFFSMSVILGVIERSFESEIRSSIDAATQKNTTNTVSQILTALCDVVVNLSADLTIKHNTPKLAGLLLHSASASALQGTPLTSLMQEADGDRLREYVAASSDIVLQMGYSAELLRPLHVHLRDADNSQVPVQLFVSSFKDADGLLGHVVGLVDCSDNHATATCYPNHHSDTDNNNSNNNSNNNNSALGTQGPDEELSRRFLTGIIESHNPGPVLPNNKNNIKNNYNVETNEIQRQRQQHEISSSSSGSSQSEEEARERTVHNTNNNDTVLVCVDATSANLVIKKKSKRFDLLVNARSIGTGLCSYVASPDHFQDWLQTQLNHVLTQTDDPVGHKMFEVAILPVPSRLPLQKSPAKHEVLGNCRLRFDPVLGAEGIDLREVCLEFFIKHTQYSLGGSKPRSRSKGNNINNNNTNINVNNKNYRSSTGRCWGIRGSPSVASDRGSFASDADDAEPPVATTLVVVSSEVDEAETKKVSL